MQAVKAAGGGMPLAPSWGGSSSPTPPAGHVTENARGRATLISRNGRAFKSGPALAQELDRTVKAWGLWSELSKASELSAIHVAAGDHVAIEMDGD